MKSRQWLVIVIVGMLLLPAMLLLDGRLGPVQTVRGKSPAVPLSDNMTPEQAAAQDLALLDARVHEYTVGRRSEVFGVREVMNHYPASSQACANADCRQVEIYNFDEDAAVTAIVNLDTNEVLDVFYLPGMHPGINKRLSDRALEIAVNHPDVIAALGFRPRAANLAPVDADLLDSSCDNQGHLCVAPNFRVGDRILWAFVDLTEERLAGIAWGESGGDGPSVPFIPEGCPPGGAVNLDGWSLSYETTGSDGLRVYNVTYNGMEVMTSGKLVEWHADYGSWGYRDSTGCSGGGGGFPIYPYGDTVQNTLFENGQPVGFELVQDFRMSNWGASCNYRYEQHAQFFMDGRFRFVGGAYGKGCGTNAMYRPVIRLDLAVDGDDNDTYARYDGANFVPQTVENYWVPYFQAGHGPHEYDPNGYVATITDINGAGYYMEPGQGQFPDGGRGDSPFIYVTLHRASEGDGDLGVIGSCCNDDHRQGPDQYVNGESIDDTNIVLWYVHQMLTDVTPGNYYCWTISGEPNPETYPCFGGPMFVPLSESAPTANFDHNGPILLTETAVFTSTSTGNPTGYLWDLGDGTTATVANPTHTYAAEGDYTVTLTVTNEAGSDSTQATMSVIATPRAAFSYQPGVGGGWTYNFTNETVGVPPISYEWDFGDGSPIVTVENPAHTYAEPGTYTVVMTATNSYGVDSASATITIVAPAAAGFTFPNPVLVNTAVQFTNNSTGTPPISYEWDFGDGTALVTTPDPVHTFTAPGAYDVTLTATNAYGSSSVTQTIMVVTGLHQQYIPFVIR